VKIGHSKRPAERLIALQREYHAPRLEILAACFGGFFMESIMHDECDAFHVRGEWFKYQALEQFHYVHTHLERIIAFGCPLRMKYLRDVARKWKLHFPTFHSEAMRQDGWQKLIRLPALGCQLSDLV
jgi:hypothetical protein